MSGRRYALTDSIPGILAAIVLLIMNRDVLWNRAGIVIPPIQQHRRFLFGVPALYH